jgi:hypothetical protein
MQIFRFVLLGFMLIVSAAPQQDLRGQYLEKYKYKPGRWTYKPRFPTRPRGNTSPSTTTTTTTTATTSTKAETSTTTQPPKTGNLNFIILHNNDMHARFEQTGVLSDKCSKADAAANKCYGGVARVATEVKRYRKQADEGTGPKVLYLNAGDTYTGTPWFTIYKDKIASDFLKILKPDAIVSRTAVDRFLLQLLLLLVAWEPRV